MSEGVPKRAIGGDWVETWDPTNKAVYYVNLATQASQWTWPEDIPKPYAHAAQRHLSQPRCGSNPFHPVTLSRFATFLTPD